MPIVSMKEILKDAEKKKYAVGCYNAIDLQMTRGILEVAEEEKSPVILCHAELHFKYTPLEKISYILVNEAKVVKAPIAILLDHGNSFSAITENLREPLENRLNSLIYKAHKEFNFLPQR